MTETAETVTPFDLYEARLRCNRTPGPENVSCHCLSACDLLPLALDEIERLRETVAFYVKAMRLNADPKGKWFKS